MARIPRLVIPGHPHHVTQRGNRRARVQEWPWSSANAHLSGSDDDLVLVAPVIERMRGYVRVHVRQVLVAPVIERYGDF